MEKTYTPDEARVLLHYKCTATVYEHIKAGRLRANKPSGKHIYIKESDLFAFMTGDEQVSAPHPYEPPSGGLDEF